MLTEAFGHRLSSPFLYGHAGMNNLECDYILFWSRRQKPNS
ncbi:hypothetical protein KNP414_05964 [Paenibacillus mucilaginosus KNP414]|uniref:Uncharacterized protein n=1 Tax=Paenibacillus mucilaginosus (strain KNP414) TaxID=1036673 RepID=F8FC87_PAEMK|nr:hypothetical protein KNP414_05964 [Paenibacillus mucilaginosus KNP414]